MKKTILFFSILFVVSTTTVYAQERVQFDKAAAKKFKSVESKIQVYLSGELVLTNEKFDTVITSKGGRPIEIVKNNTTTVKIRYKEKGKIDHWSNDTVWVSFSTEDKQLFTVPFRPSASGYGNDGNTLIIRLDRKSTPQIDGSPGIEEETNYVTLNGKKYTLSDNSLYLEYEPVLQEKNKKVKVVSKGVVVK